MIGTKGANMTRLPFRLKTKRLREDYPRDECCVSRCHEAPEVIYDGMPAAGALPLCGKHWEILAQEED
jgi:hypothetical protein